MNVPRINPSSSYEQNQLSRIQENLARAIEQKVPGAAAPRHTLMVGVVNGDTLPAVTSDPQQLKFSSTLAWRTVPPFAGNVVQMSSWLFVASGSPVNFFVYVNNQNMFNVQGAYSVGTMMQPINPPVPFNAGDIVELRVRSSTSDQSTSVQLMAYMVIEESNQNA